VEATSCSSWAGTVGEFGDEDGGVDELLELLGKKLKVKKVLQLS
jgi:hypothetical protein